MSDDKALLKGLQDEDVERGRIKRPPVPYISPVDLIQDNVESKSSTKNCKVVLPDGTIGYHAVFNNGLNEAFIIHVQEVLNFCNRKGFFKAYNKSMAHFEDCSTRSNMAKAMLTDAKNDPTTSKERMKALKKSLELATTAVVLAKRLSQGEGSNFSPSTSRS